MNIGYTTEEMKCVFCRKKTHDYFSWQRKGVVVQFGVCEYCLGKYGRNEVIKVLKRVKTIGFRTIDKELSK